MTGVGYYVIPAEAFQLAADLFQFQQVLGRSYQEYLILLCASSTRDNAMVRGAESGINMDTWTVLNGDIDPPSNEHKRRWKIMRDGMFKGFVTTVVEFMVEHIGKAYINCTEVTVISRPKGARRGFWHTDVKLAKGGESTYATSYWNGEKGPVCNSVWMPFMDDELGKLSRVN